MKLHELESDEPLLNLTPMIDVVFNLLVFFMLATTFLQREQLLGLELPAAASASPAARPLQELVIEISREGTTWIAGNQVDGTELARLLADAAHTDPARPVTVRGDRRVYHEQVVHVLDECLRAGLSNLALSTREGD
ncbi:MAG: ExbD/TolR family protein [Planctomycetota bacterium]